jgi:hypothetical protein
MEGGVEGGRGAAVQRWVRRCGGAAARRRGGAAAVQRKCRGGADRREEEQEAAEEAREVPLDEGHEAQIELAPRPP